MTPARARRSTNRAGVTLASAFAVFFGAIGLLVGRRVLGDNSFFTHLATGNLILERGSIPRTDPYSFTANGEPWVVQSWLASLLYASLDRLLGGFGIRLMNGLLCAAVGALVWRLTSRRSEQVFVPLGLTGGVLIVGSMMWSPRPLLFGLLGLTLVLSVVEGLVNPLWLLPIMWVWVNTHGSFPMAGVLAATLVVGAWLDDRRVPERELKLLGWCAPEPCSGASIPWARGCCGSRCSFCAAAMRWRMSSSGDRSSSTGSSPGSSWPSWWRSWPPWSRRRVGG